MLSGEKLVESLFRCLESGDYPLAVSALRLLMHVGAKDMDVLKGLLSVAKHGNEMARRLVVEHIGELYRVAPQEIEEVYLNALSDPSAMVRYEAITSLPEEIYPRVLSQLVQKPLGDLEMRALLLRIPARNKEKLVEEEQRFIVDAAKRGCGEAILCLGNKDIDSSVALEILSGALESPFPYIRRMAANAIGEREEANEQIIDSLGKIARSDNLEEKNSALYALERLSHCYNSARREFLSALGEMEPERRAIWCPVFCSWKNIDESVLDVLRPAIEWMDSSVLAQMAYFHPVVLKMLTEIAVVSDNVRQKQVVLDALRELVEMNQEEEEEE